MKKLDKDILKSLLKQNTYKVTFEKVNGEMRDMICTLDPELIPEESFGNGSGDRVENPDVLPVYDIEVGGWRSFRIKNIKIIAHQSEI